MSGIDERSVWTLRFGAPGRTSNKDATSNKRPKGAGVYLGLAGSQVQCAAGFVGGRSSLLCQPDGALMGPLPDCQEAG